MRPLTLASVADFSGGSLLRGQLETVVYGVSTDTRTVEAGPCPGKMRVSSGRTKS